MPAKLKRKNFRPSKVRKSSVKDELGAQLVRYSIDVVSDMIIWLDEDGRYLFVNKAAIQFLGYSAEELSQLRVCDVDPDFDEDRWRRHWSELEEKHSVRLETSNNTKSGTNIPIEVNASLVYFHGKKYNCSIVRDISDRKRAEAELMKLTEQIYQLSITDGLTGITNRRRFDEIIAKEFERSQNLQLPLSVVLLDVDFFKPFNDIYGHLNGDECLRRVASTIAAHIRLLEGVAARYGGEEFVCVLPGVNLMNAMQFAERIRNEIAMLKIPHEGSAFGVVTVSLGVASAENPILNSCQKLLSEADRCLYRAKHLGRNRVEENRTPSS